mmetsp:Transcript_73833/g.142786  ORF Transcript_73833/g.142786 Transcript_73833/m.142786 type:complete len:201 (-) Transcript_73833:1444-2046(-)
MSTCQACVACHNPPSLTSDKSFVLFVQRSIVQAAEVALFSLEGVESCLGLICTSVPALLRGTMGFRKQVEIADSLYFEDLHQALVNEEVFSPMAVTRTQLREVILAMLVTLRPDLHRLARKYLKRTMHAKLAIVDVHCMVAALYGCHCCFQPGRKKDAIWVNLDCPIVQGIAAHLNSLCPDCQEDVQIQCCLELTSNLTL